MPDPGGSLGPASQAPPPLPWHQLRLADERHGPRDGRRVGFPQAPFSEGTRCTHAAKRQIIISLVAKNPVGQRVGHRVRTLLIGAKKPNRRRNGISDPSQLALGSDENLDQPGQNRSRIEVRYLAPFRGWTIAIDPVAACKFGAVSEIPGDSRILVRLECCKFVYDTARGGGRGARYLLLAPLLGRSGLVGSCRPKREPLIGPTNFKFGGGRTGYTLTPRSSSWKTRSWTGVSCG
jgi:hypothetical protein